MNTVTWRTLREHPVRFALALVAVTMGVAFVCATLTLRTMLTDTFGSMTATMPADAYVRAVADPGSSGSGDRGLVPLSLAADLEQVDGAAQVRPSIIGPVVLVGQDGNAVGIRHGGAQRPGDQGTPSPSYGMAVEQSDAGTRLIAGAFPTGASQVLLDQDTAERAGLSVGDTTRVEAATDNLTVEVAGIADISGFPEGATLVGFDSATATSLFASSGLVAQILVSADSGVDASVLTERVAQAVATSHTVEPATVEVVDAQVIRDETATELDQSMGAYTSAFTALALASLLVGMFIIANTFTMVVRQQSRQTAVMRAIGAGRSQVLSSVLAQAGLIGVVGSVLGAVGGYALVAAMRAALSWMNLELTGQIPFSATTIAVSLVLGIVVSVVSALLPARRAAGTAPIAAIRELSGAPQRMRMRAIVGIALLAIGVAGTVVALRGGESGQAALLAGVLLTPISVVVLAPVVLPTVLRALALPAAALGGVTGTLAGRNAVRDPRRSAATACALMIGMTLIGLVSVFIASTSASLRTGLDDELQADVVVQSVQGAVPEALVDTIATAPAAAQVDTLRYATLKADGSNTAVGNLSEGAREHSLAIPVVSGSLDTLAAGQIAVQETLLTERGWRLGDTIELVNARTQTTANPAAVTIGAVIDSGSLGSNILVGDGLYDELVPEQMRATGTVFATAGMGDAAALQAELSALADPYPAVSALGKQAYIASILATVEQIQTIFYAVLAIALLVSLLAIVNLISLSVSERTREIGMLRAAGVERGQVAAMVLVESALITVFGAIVGLAVGVGVSTPLAVVFRSMGVRVLALPWGQLGIILALAAVAGVLAAVLPARRAAGLPVLQAITSN